MPGAIYTIPAQISLALHAEKKHKQWLETPEARMFGARVKDVLPDWMFDCIDVNITEDTIKEVCVRQFVSIWGLWSLPV